MGAAAGKGGREQKAREGVNYELVAYANIDRCDLGFTGVRITGSFFSVTGCCIDE